MFGLFSKKPEEPAPATAPTPDPAAQQRAEREKKMAVIADLQSQISVLTVQRRNEEAEVAALTAMRDETFAKIASVPDAQKVGLAREVNRLNGDIEARNGTISLIDAGIRKNNQVIRQIINMEVVNTSAIEIYVDLDDHTKDVLQAREKAADEKVKVDMAADATAELIGTASTADDKAEIARTIAQAMASQTVPAPGPGVPATDDPEVATILAASARMSRAPAP